MPSRGAPRSPGPAAIRARVRALADRTIAAHSARFFKAAPGEYGAGDRFLGLRVPALRALAREVRGCSTATACALLASRWHEERLLALLLLVARFAHATETERGAIHRRYLASIAEHVDNWDLVDTSAPTIVGGYLERRSRRPLQILARSPNVWKRRVAVIATLKFIKQGDFDDTLALAEALLGDENDLIHKATGWMLREVGKRDRAVLEAFLDRHCTRMPRTMLRYAIEKLPPARRRHYLERG